MTSDPAALGTTPHGQGNGKKDVGEVARTWRGRRREIGNCLWMGPSDVRDRRDASRNWIA
jgi:hypothetical protein